MKTQICMSGAPLYKQILKQYATFKSIQKSERYEMSMYPLVWKRAPQSYKHVCSTFVVSTDHPVYETCKQHIVAWHKDCVYPSYPAVVDCSGKVDYDDIQSKGWYVIDLRSKPDLTIRNTCTLKNMKKTDASVVNAIAFACYERAQSLVVFADSVEDVPRSLMTLSVVGLTTDENQMCNDFIYTGCCKQVSPTNSMLLTTTTSPTTRLLGYNRFEEQPIVCYLSVV